MTATVFDCTDQYWLQAEVLTKAIVEDLPVPWPLEDSVANLVVIEAIFESAKQGRWVDVKIYPLALEDLYRQVARARAFELAVAEMWREGPSRGRCT